MMAICLYMTLYDLCMVFLQVSTIVSTTCVCYYIHALIGYDRKDEYTQEVFAIAVIIVVISAIALTHMKGR